MPPPTLFSPSKTSLITGLPGIVIIIPLYIVYLTKTHSWGEKLIFSLGSAPFGSFTFCYIFNFLFMNLFYMNLLMSLFPADPVFTVTILHLDLPLFCYILFPKCIFSFTVLSSSSLLGCRVSEQCGNWTQATPGKTGWDLFYKDGLPPSSALHAADGQQCNPWADCSARY